MPSATSSLTPAWLNTNCRNRLSATGVSGSHPVSSGCSPSATARTLRGGAAGALVVEQPDLAVDPAPVAGHRAVGPDDAVAGDDDAHGVAAVGQADRPGGARPAHPPGQLAVA